MCCVLCVSQGLTVNNNRSSNARPSCLALAMPTCEEMFDASIQCGNYNQTENCRKKTTCFSSSNMCITWNCNRISLIVQFPDYNVVVFLFVVVVVAMQSAVAAFIYLFFFFCFLLLLARQKCIAIFPVLISLEACNLVSCTLHKCIFQLCARACEENECIGKFN